MNDFGKFVENLHKMTNFEKSPKSPQIHHYFFVPIFQKKNNTLTQHDEKTPNLKFFIEKKETNLFDLLSNSCF